MSRGNRDGELKKREIEVDSAGISEEDWVLNRAC